MNKEKLIAFFKKETILCISGILAFGSAFLIPPDAKYMEYCDIRVLVLLFCLMAVMGGFQQLGVFDRMANLLLARARRMRQLATTLVMLCFFSAMFVTNDVALITFVPFTIMLLEQLGCRSQVICVTVFQTVAANLGSMTTPVGNPQNLYLYSFYNLSIGDFFSVTLWLALVSFLVLSAGSLFLLPKKLPAGKVERADIANGMHLLIYSLLFVLCLLTVFRVIPYPITTAITIMILLIINRKLLKEIDYMLLLTFVCFFIVSENLGRMDAIRNALQQLLQGNTLLTAVGTSQVISNVPAAVVLSGFTDRWQELLAGVNIGGLGTPIASLASLITLKFYMRWPYAKVGKFLAYFMAANIAGLIILLLFAQWI